MLFVHKSFCKKSKTGLKIVLIASITHTTDVYLYRPTYQKFICTHFYPIICENLFLWESFWTLSHLWVLFVHKSFCKKSKTGLKVVLIASITHTTDVYPYRLTYQKFVCTHLFLPDHLWESFFMRIFFNLSYLWESFLAMKIFLNLSYLWKSLLICNHLYKSMFFLRKLLLSVRISSFLRGLFFFMITFFICASLCLYEDKKHHHLKQIQIFKKGCLYSVNRFKKLTHYFCALNASNFCWLWAS